MEWAREDEPYGENPLGPTTDEIADDANRRMFRWRRLGAVIKLGEHGKMPINSIRVSPGEEPGQMIVKHREGKGKDRHKNTKYIVVGAGVIIAGLAALEYERRKRK